MEEKLFYAKSRKTSLSFVEESFDVYEGETLKKELFNLGDYKSFDVKDYELTEILSPASKSSYKQAIYGGADAIYFGYKEFNARASGENFESIKEVVDFCHFYNVKAYLALNICFTNSELPQVKEIVKEAEEANIDAFIICDLSLVPIIRGYSKAAIHASTQLGTHNSWGMDFLKDMGFNRAVLSREMSFEDIKSVTDTRSIETEVFIHGALCSCFSGGCLLSSMLTGNSANRGKCNQLCRKFYKSFVNGKPAIKGFLLSAKDICMDKYIKDLIDIGVSSLKIEGRLKREEYVGGVTMYYSDLKKGVEPIFDKDDIKVLFNRGNYTAGYFENNNVIYTGQPNHIGIYAGKVVHVLGENKAYVASDVPLESNNGYKVLRNQKEIGGVLATGEYNKNFSVVKSNVPLKIGDEIRLTSDASLAVFICNRKKRKVVPIQVRIAGGEKPQIILNIKGHKYTYTGKDYVQTAINHPITEEEIKTLFEGSKVREVKFVITDLQLYNAFLTKSQLNQIRRDLLDSVWRFLLGYYERTKKIFDERPIPKYEEETSRKLEGDFCEVDSIEIAKIALKQVKNIVYNPEIFVEEECQNFYRNIKKDDNNIFIKLPIYIPVSQEVFFESIIKIFDGVCANNIGGAYVARKLKKLLLCGPNLNIMNTKSWFIKNSCSYVVSPELNYTEVKRFKNPIIYAYGYLPLMYLNFCPRKVSGMQCGECKCELKFADEKGEYLITTQKFNGYCEHILHNAVLTDVGTRFDRARKYFDFCLRDKKEAETILSYYYGDKEYLPKNTNKLHLTRGVL